MTVNEASRRQIHAAEPGQSTWLSANAGSGKTRVLIDRVARLLLAGTAPQKILCLTYTKAAAGEMQNRLFERLGTWAMLPEAKLREALRALGADVAVTPETLAAARRLFARAIETPGGLKIQTIHSFCAAVLRRFPLEALVSPDFTELDDQARRQLYAQILDEMADETRPGSDPGAVDALASLLGGEDLDHFLDRIGQNRDGFQAPLSRADAVVLFGLPSGFDGDALLREVFSGGEAALMSRLRDILGNGSPSERKSAETLVGLTAELRSPEDLALLERVLLRGKDAEKHGPFTARIGDFPTKTTRANAAAELMPDLEALMLRVEAARPRRLALAAAERAAALHRFAVAFLARYDAHKAARGFLDFDDLIRRTAALLSSQSVASWVLYRLDGGIDHMLVDEAQDTSPAQWEVIAHLAREFTAGESAREVARTLFVVGDKKQSIYSFQGADLGVFDRMREDFRTRHHAAQLPFQPLELVHSFRSSSAILDVVDLTFDDRAGTGLGGAPKHRAFHETLPGRVDVWAQVPKTEKPDQREWFEPVDILADDHHAVVLAKRLARQIRRMIDAGVRIPKDSGSKAVDAGDFLVLVQRRSDHFHEIIRACKKEGLEIAGADRLRLGGEVAVKDLVALLSFLALPEDDLSLASALRSPLFGVSEAELFDLAQPRPEGGFLWSALREGAEAHGETLAVLDDLRRQADFLRPYELLERMLIRHNGRRRLIGRLGIEAEDGIDALLDQALAYEAGEAPSLTGFLVWLQSEEVTVRRRADSAPGALRVMTVHGAKGLESPIVILPDTATPRNPRQVPILTVGDQAVWRTPAIESPAEIAEAAAAEAARRREERMRLLYVAMTRAKCWLIVCGAADAGDPDSWYRLVKDGAERAGAVLLPAEDEAFGPGLRVEHGDWPPNEPAPASETPARRVVLPDWAETRAGAPPASEAMLSPSALGGAKALAGDAGLDDAAAMRRGTLLHALLEELPDWPETSWRALADQVLARAAPPGTPAPDSAETETLFAEARTVLRAPELRPLFAPGTLSEVEIVAPVAALGGRRFGGAIDRLVIGPERVLAIDYKSNAIVPDRPEAVPEGILRQMGAYREMLAAIYPDRRIETAILWTRTGALMALPPEIVRAALGRTTIP
ncbi:MAG: double-strand break repair helicase AddA [Defluviimonas sp.]|uniref:double-strand break repair helicase AddA n=1 Tax=Albidovulum sp. TaxID=1872424 RepID=UPI002A27A8F1|nr:double-strand break repair helicase AddA [Defluviimonas sp.]